MAWGVLQSPIGEVEKISRGRPRQSASAQLFLYRHLCGEAYAQFTLVKPEGGYGGAAYLGNGTTGQNQAGKEIGIGNEPVLLVEAAEIIKHALPEDGCHGLEAKTAAAEDSIRP